ncbi:NIL domain-containing protein [Candidatus Omnitrophota bacterium]
MEKIKFEFTFPEELKNEPIFYLLVKNFDIIPNIIEASFSTDTGWAVLTLEGEEQELKKAIDYLKSRKVSMNILDK